MIAITMVPAFVIVIILAWNSLTKVNTLHREIVSDKMSAIANSAEMMVETMPEDEKRQYAINALATEYELDIMIIRNGAYAEVTNGEYMSYTPNDIKETTFEPNDYVNGIRHISYYKVNDAYSIQVCQSYDNYMTHLKKFQTNIFVLATITLIGSSIILWLISNQVVKEILKSSEAIQILSCGTLNLKEDEFMAKKEDEIGDVYNNAIALSQKLTGIVTNINDVSENLSKALDAVTSAVNISLENTGGISSAVNEVAQGATSQAQECSDGTNTTANINVAIEELSSKANELDKTSQEMQELEEVSYKSLNALVEQNNASVLDIEVIGEKIKKTNDSIGEVNKIVEAIQAIASQTNLLSLNASIEAARAGEAGRGFSVVANEIKNLSEQTTNLSKEILTVMDTLNDSSIESIEKMKGVLENTKEQTKTIEDTKIDFESLDAKIKRTSSGINEITKSVQALGENSESMVDALSNLSAISEENAASAEECAASVEQLNVVMEDLKSQVADLDQDRTQLLEAIKFFKL